MCCLQLCICTNGHSLYYHVFHSSESQEVKSNPLNYDAWFDYLRLLEDDGNVEQIRDTYERAIANVPPAQVSLRYRFHDSNAFI